MFLEPTHPGSSQSIVAQMLYMLCQSIDFKASAVPEQASWFPGKHTRGPKHHASFTDLESSANNGCELCQFLFRYGALPSIQAGGIDYRGHGLDQIYYRTYNANSYEPPRTGYYKHYYSRTRDSLNKIQFFLEHDGWEPENACGHRFPPALELIARYGNCTYMILGRSPF